MVSGLPRTGTATGRGLAWMLAFVASGPLAPACGRGQARPTDGDATARSFVPPRLDAARDDLPCGALRWLGATPMRHEGIGALVFAPDGRRFATVGSDGRVRVWATGTGQAEVAIPHGEGSAGVTPITWSPDGRLLAVGRADGYVNLWDSRTGERVLEFRAYEHWMGPLAFSPDGRLLATSAADGPLIRVWAASSGDPVRDVRLDGESTPFEWDRPEPAKAIAFTRDNRSLRAMDAYGFVRSWDLSTGAEAPVEKRMGDDPVASAVFARDGAIVAWQSRAHSICVRDLEAGRTLLCAVRQELRDSTCGFYHPGNFVVSSDGRAVAEIRDRLRLWSAVTGRMVFEVGGRETLACAALSPDGSLLASGSKVGRIRLWDATTGEELLRSDEGLELVASRLAWSSAGDDLLAIDVDGSAAVIHAATTAAPVIRGVNLDPGERVLDFSADGRLVAVVNRDLPLGIRPPESDDAVRVLAPDRSIVTASCAAFTPNGEFLASAHGPGPGTPKPVIRLWDVATGAVAVEVTSDAYAIERLVFSPDGRRLASIGRGGELELWTASGLLPIRTGRPAGERIRGIAFSPGDGSVVSWGGARGFAAWDPNTGSVVSEGATGGPTAAAAAYSRDGRWLAIAWASDRLELFDSTMTESVAEFATGQPAVTSLAFSGDAMTLASAGSDGTVLLWDLTRFGPRVVEPLN
ncbi:MAG: WD40 repeat domain-containing protein [Acidobacteria bacterium]|nr:WD40 repeat domain-containing protein [Acidobacteriota bacterium]